MPKRRISWLYWPFQFGGAFTMPWAGRTVILTRSTSWVTEPGHEFHRVHERVHAAQIERWGARRYICQVMVVDRLVSLVRHGNLLATDSEAEKEAYGEAARFTATGHSAYDDAHYEGKED